MANDAPQDSQARPRRVHSINFQSADDDWIESVVDILRRAGLPKAGRSEVVRVALAELQATLADHTPVDTVRFFLDRDIEWRRSRIELPNAGRSS